MESLVSTEWLEGELGADDLIVLDASAHLPAAQRDAEADFVASHIPGARFLDLPSLKDENSSVPSALPTSQLFEQRMRSLGVTSASRVVLYDDSHLRSSARAWFIFRMFGFAKLAILDGGLEKWRAERRPLDDGEPDTAKSAFTVTSDDRRKVRSKTDMLANCASRAEQVVDARDADRFAAVTEDTVHGLEGGHIPHARNVFFRDLLDESGCFKDNRTLTAIFEQAGLDLEKPITASCGSGMTASVLLFALDRIGHTGNALYDGSWAEWGADPDTPKEKGAAR